MLHYFYVTEPVELSYVRRDHGPQTARSFRRSELGACPDAIDPSDRRVVGTVRLGAPHDGKLSADSLYFALSKPFFQDLQTFARAANAPRLVKMLRIGSEAVAMRRLGLAPRVGNVRSADSPFAPIEEQLRRVRRRRGDLIRIAVINMFNPAYGDTIISLGPLRQLVERLRTVFGAVELDLLQHPDNLETTAIYHRSGIVHAIRNLPAPLSILREYDAYIDLCADRLPTDKHWLDGFLDALGIDSATVSVGEKRNHLPRSGAASDRLVARVEALRARGKPLLLFHPLASTRLRAFPPDVAARFLIEVLERTDWQVMTAVPVGVRHARLTDLSAETPTFDDLVEVISRATMFISADTCVYHVADAFDVPGVVLFTSIAPEMRVRYYPYVAGIALAQGDNPLLGTHWSEETADVSVAQAMWRNLDVDHVLATLSERMRQRYASVPALSAASEMAVS